MIRQENRFNYFGSAVFAFLFFLLVFAFSGNLGKPATVESPYKFASELYSNATAVVVEIQEIHTLNVLIPIVDKSNFKSFDEGLHLAADNNAAHQRIIFLRSAGLKIKPVILHRLFRQYHFVDTDDLPHLS